MDWLFKHKLMTLGLVVVIAAIVWYFISDSSSSSSVLTAESATSVPPDAEKLVQSLSTLRAVTLDGAVFQNSAFQALQDYSKPIVPEPVGRTNPFAAISSSEIAS